MKSLSWGLNRFDSCLKQTFQGNSTMTIYYYGQGKIRFIGGLDPHREDSIEKGRIPLSHNKHDNSYLRIGANETRGNSMVSGLGKAPLHCNIRYTNEEYFSIRAQRLSYDDSHQYYLKVKASMRCKRRQSKSQNCVRRIWKEINVRV